MTTKPKAEPESSHPSLDAALLAAQQDVKGIAPDARNEFSGYDYTSSEAIIRGARDHLITQGILVERVGWMIERETELGGTVHSTFRVAHPESKQERVAIIPWPALIIKGRPWDKAVAGALTTSFSYWLRDLLAIPRSEDHGMDTRDDSEYVPPKKVETAAPSAVKKDKAQWIDRIKTKKNVPEVLEAVAKIVPLRDRFADVAQHSEILAAAFLHGLSMADEEERNSLLDCAGKHKAELAGEYENVLDQFREGWEGL